MNPETVQWLVLPPLYLGYVLLCTPVGWVGMGIAVLWWLKRGGVRHDVHHFGGPTGRDIDRAASAEECAAAIRRIYGK